MIKGLYQIFKRWGENTCWIISDTHFDDPDLIHAYSDRPTAAEQVKIINSKVGKNDTLIILGDVGNVEWVKQLRGYKVLVCGNHDAGISNYERHRWYRRFSAIVYSKEQALMEMKSLHPNCKYKIKFIFNAGVYNDEWEVCADNNLFDEIYEGPVMIGEKLILSHEPIEGLDWCYNLHGHDHSRDIVNDDHHFNVCADVINYTPINFNRWMKEGHLAKVKSLHRQTIDEATDRRRRKGYRLGG